MDVFEQIERMEPYLRVVDWDGLERDFMSVCREGAGEAQSVRISKIDLAGYQAELREGLAGALKAASEAGAKAIYFEYDLDNGWQSTLFVCQDYQPQSEGDDDWACEWTVDIEGPALEEFGRVYSENGFDGTDRAIGSTAFLIARTVAAFGRAAEGLDTGEIAVCIAFHDQDPIMRVREQS